MITWVLFFITIAISVRYLLLHNRRLHELFHLIPGPKPWPIIGNVLYVMGSLDEAWLTLREEADTYYPIWCCWVGMMPMVNIRHPDDIEIILGNNTLIRKSKLYSFLEPYFSTGLITSAVAKWEKRRKMLTPAFHFNVLQKFVEIFIEQGEYMIESLKKEGGPVVKELIELSNNYTLNVFCETAMGISLQGKGEMQQTYVKAVHDMHTIAAYRIIRPWLYSDFIFGLVPTGWRQRKVAKVWHEFSDRIISERKIYHEKTGGQYLMNLDKENSNGAVENDNDIGIRKRRLAMLDLLLAAQRQNLIDDEGIREEVTTFVAAGHDTVTLCISYTIMLFAEHKEIQERARAEVNAVLDENDGKMSLSVLQRLTYLERCIKESLRLYPSVHFVSREIDEAVRLSNYVVPKGTMVNVHIVDIHRDPNFWPEPEIFDPDRFLPEKVEGRHRYAYIPFSAGARNCIGQRFGMLQLKALMGMLLRNFYLEPIDYLKDIRFTLGVTMLPKHPIHTKFIPIN